MPAGDFSKMSLKGGGAPTGLQKVQGTSTVFEMDIEKGRKVYRYDVTIYRAQREGQKELTKQSDLGQRTMQKMVCMQIVDYLHRINKITGKYVYDGKSMLFSTERFGQINNCKIEQPSTVSKEVDNFVKSNMITANVTANERLPVLDYSNLEQSLISAVDEQADHSCRQFLELVTSQYLINTGKYHQVGAGTVFNRDCVPLVPGMELRPGLSKGVRVAEHEGKLRALLVADMRRSAFVASSRPLSEIYKEMVRQPRDTYAFNDLFRATRIKVSHRQNHSFTFKALTDRPLNDKSFLLEDGSGIAHYFKRKYNVTINPNLPGAIVDAPMRDGHQTIMPLDVCQVMEGQLVPAEKINEQAVRKLVMENSVFPDKRYNYVMQMVKLIGTGPGAAFLKNFGITVKTDSNAVDIYRLKPFKLKAAGGTPFDTEPNGSFFKTLEKIKLMTPSALLKNWWAVYDDRSVDPNQAKEYVGLLQRYATSSGFNLPAPQKVTACSGQALQKLFEEAAKQKIQLLEAYYKVLTQQVITKNMVNKPQTLKNVILKTNVKAFGINYMPVFPDALKEFDVATNPDLLVIGYDVAHPPAASPQERAKAKRGHGPDPFADGVLSTQPSVVGICGNRGANPAVFGGDFYFQESRRENCGTDRLRKAVSDIVAGCKRNKRVIKRVLVIRDGVSEGQLEMCSRQELPAVKAGFRDVFTDAECKPKFTFVVATKRHNKRFYELSDGKVQNTRVGDLVATKVVRQDVGEFYLQSHHPLKGVPKMTQYSVVANELNISRNNLFGIMRCYSSMHQVSSCPTSLPLPVYLADELAKRGSDVYKALMVLRSRDPKNVILQGMAGTKSGLPPCDALSERFGYSKHPLGGTRFNA